MKKTSISGFHEILSLGLNSSFERYVEGRKAFLEAKSAPDSNEAAGMRRLYTAWQNAEVNRVAVVLFAASFVEALINGYLIMALSSEEFSALEKWSPLEKWAIGPRIVERSYR